MTALSTKAVALPAPTNTGEALPATGVVLIGTPATIREMARAIESLEQTCVITGCVLTDRFSAARDEADRSGHVQEPLPPLLGFIDDLTALTARYGFKLALVSLPSAQSRSMNKITATLDRIGLARRFVPTWADAVLGRCLVVPATGDVATGSSVTSAQPATPAADRVIDIVELIGRSQAQIDAQAIERIITGKRVLITGAGGSIGGELARVCARFAPASLLLVERAENALFQIDHEMGRRCPQVERRAILHDINDPEQTLRLMLEHRPQVVFHSAAHKHVPLMEDHPALAVGNNLFATKSIADAAVACGCERFVMISSDKAVNPTSVMGATKRLAELYVASLAAGTGTRLSMVRFGNVLASACSVIPIWSQQLADGGPITVTDPRMTRYFMTIPEAATLVVQAAALEQPAGRAPVYVLDMGEPIRILDLAQRFAVMHGFTPSVRWTPETRTLIDDNNHTPPLATPRAGAAELEIVFSGVRPGEKLFEQLAYDAEQLAPTSHAHINQWSAAAPGEGDPLAAMRMVADLMPMRSASADKATVIATIRKWVPEMTRGS